MGLELLGITIMGTEAITVSLMFLPAAMELVHPKDAGPRSINDSAVMMRVVSLTNIEEEHIVDSFPHGIAVPLDFLANVETLF